MTPPPIQGTAASGGWAWGRSLPDLELRFFGRGAQETETESSVPPLAWAKQVHSARVLEVATAGSAGEGDALWTSRRGVALRVITADCVPVLLAGRETVVAVHAGWRGLVAGVLESAVTEQPEPSSALSAWVGPAIGPCCYEVGEEVAREVAEASGSGAIVPRSPRPHLDLHHAAEVQLRRLGIAHVERVALCTRCRPELLHSYRREGSGAGRNMALIWRPSEPAP